MGRGEHSRVSRVLQFTLAPFDGDRMDVEFRYDTGDPYAVHALFSPSGSDPVCWVFAREMLALGLAEPAGEGDVRIEPAVFDSEFTCLVLVGLNGQVRLELASADIAAFLGATYEVVPPGEESEWLDLDRELDEFFSRRMS